jgi:hypothetical protein
MELSVDDLDVASPGRICKSDCRFRTLHRDDALCVNRDKAVRFTLDDDVFLERLGSGDRLQSV